MSFIQLEVHSEYDILSSTITLETWKDYALSQNHKILALVDGMKLYGAYKFYQLCQRYEIQPLIGISISCQIEDQLIEVLAYAKNEQGFKSLMIISTLLSQNNSLSWQNLYEYQNNLIYIIKADAQQNQQWCQTFTKLTPYIAINELTRELLTTLQLQKAVYIRPVRYLYPQDIMSYQTALAIRNNERLDVRDIYKQSGQEYYLSEQDQMQLRQSYPELKQAFDETMKIAEQCQLTLDNQQLYLPKFPLPSTYDSVTAYFESFVKQQANEKYADLMQLDNYRSRLAYELTTICQMGFADYFLIVADFINYARQQGINVGPGRGSAAGSLVAYVLGITQADPIAYDLLFERFLNPERVSLPDIDIDIQDTRRDEVIQYVTEKYGRHNVAQIVTFGTLSARAVARETARVFQFKNEELKFISKHIPHRLKITLKEAYQESLPLQQFIAQGELYQRWFKIALSLEGHIRNTSTHAAGVIISSQALDDIVPLNDQGDHHITQWTMDDLEAVGLLKMDFLGLKNLTLIERVVKQIKKQQPDFTLNNIDYKDKAVFDYLSRGQTNGIFQLESAGMRRVLMNLKPNSFDDIIAVLALYRPGPMEQIPMFIARKHGQQQISYPHEDLKNILDSTYGIMIYQEQVMKIAAIFAGFSLSEADNLRRAISKKNHQQLEDLRQKFVEGAVQKGYDAKLSQEIYQLINKFGDYGFNKSHAVVYAMISYQLAYLKYYYPAYFMSALLSSVTLDEQKVKEYVQESRKLGLQVMRPDINFSDSYYKVIDDKIYFALTSIKNVGFQSVKAIVQERYTQGEFKSLDDLLERVPKKILTGQVLNSLIEAGALDSFGYNRATLFHMAQKLTDKNIKVEGKDIILTASGMSIRYEVQEEWSDSEKLRREKEVIGFYFSQHPINTIYQQKYLLPLKKIQKIAKTGYTYVEITRIRVIKTKTGQQMAFLTLFDGDTEIDAVIFPNLYLTYRRFLEQGKQRIMLVKKELTKKEIEQREQLIINEVVTLEKFETDLRATFSKMFIKITDEEDLKLLKQFCKLTGKIAVYLYYEKTNQYQAYGYLETNDILQELEKKFNENVIKISR